MSNAEMSVDRYLHHDDRSSDLSDIVDEWDSASDDSLDENSSIRENGYWINAMIQELAVCKPSNEVKPNILPALDDMSSLSNADSSNNHVGNLKKESLASTIKVNEEERVKDVELNFEEFNIPRKFDPTSKVDDTLRKTIRTLLKVASDTYDESQDTLDSGSDCSSLTISQATQTTISDKRMLQNDDKKIEHIRVDTTTLMTPCTSDDSTVACDNKRKKNSSTTGIGSEITMDTTDNDDSQGQGTATKDNTWERKRLRASRQPSPKESNVQSSTLSPRPVSIVISSVSVLKDELNEFDSLSGSSCCSSLTVSDEESQYEQSEI